MNEKDTHTNDNGKKTMVKRRKKVKLGEKGAKKTKLEKKLIQLAANMVLFLPF